MIENNFEEYNTKYKQSIRLGIMSILVVNDAADFNMLKELLGVTDGNLASHTKALELQNYIFIEKKFIGKKTNTTYKLTNEGKIAFKNHIDALEKLIKQN